MQIGNIKHLPESYFRRVEFTTRLGCSVGCTFCPQKRLIEATRGEERILKNETVAEILENLRGSHVREVHFSGFSEPFLNNDCGDFIQMTHEAGFEIVVFSVLKGLTRETLEKIKDVPIKLFHVSVQPPGLGTRPGLEDDYFWDQVDMLLSVKHRFQLRFGCVASDYSEKEREVLERKSRSLGIRIIHGEMLDRAGNLPNGRSRHQAPGTRLVCTRNIGFVILPGGDCVWCSMDYGTLHRVGNLRNISYNQMLCAQPVQNMLKKMERSGNREQLLCLQCESSSAVSILNAGKDFLKKNSSETRIMCTENIK